MATVSERFWAKVRKSDGCWEWTASLSTTGYGQFRMTESSKEKAHRASYMLAHGAIPDGLWVLHHCDNPPCVRPDHLYAGTPKDNAADMVHRGRHRPFRGGRGSANARAAFTDEQVALVRRQLAAGRTQQSIADEYGVTQCTISRIKRRVAYAEVD